jgi:hypothetical protein
MDFTRSLSLLIMAGAIFNTSTALGTTYYVAKAGSNSHSCAQAVNPSTPKQTINAGISCLSAGDTLVVGNGTYAESLTNPFSNTGSSWANKITVKAQNTKQVTISPSSGDYIIWLGTSTQKYIEFDGLVLEGNKVISIGYAVWWNAHHIRFQNGAILRSNDVGVSMMGDPSSGVPQFNEVINTEVAYVAMNEDGTTRTCMAGSVPWDGLCHALYIGSDDHLFDRLDMHHNNGCGPHLYPQGYNHNNIVRNSIVHDNYAAGICSLGDDNQIINNVVYNNQGGGFLIHMNRALIYNNTVYNNDSSFNYYGGMTIKGGSGHSVKNNLFFQNDVTGISLDSTNLIGVNPQFVDAANINLRLKAGSPGIDAGTALPLTTDIDGAARPQGAGYDVGAYEFGVPHPPMNLRVN